VGNDGGALFFETDKSAPRGRLIAVEVDRPRPEHWREVIPQGDDILASVGLVHDSFVTRWMRDACHIVRIFDLDGRPLHEIELPTLGTVSGLSGRRDDAETFYMFTSFLHAPSIYRYDFVSGRSEVFRAPQSSFDASKYATEQVFYRSKDGTRVPMFLVHRRDLRRDGRNPTLLYGYGGFNVPMLPAYSVSTLVWLELGGIYAQACLRGGSEYGEEWHQAGMLDRKQNVFDDFIAAAEYLVAQGYTQPAKLAISGGSNGGLLVGACLNQRPELFGAALPAVGVMDMLRFHKFTIGWAWVSDYGSADVPEQFRTLYAYSPYHNIRDGVSYPATLITTADHDDRVVPGHSFKYAARLQQAQAGSRPILIRVQTRAGHGAGKPTTMQIDEQTDVWAFLVKALGIEVGEGI
jgi:prolyl oligopeptidase